MASKPSPAPLFVDAFSLCEWLNGRLTQNRDALSGRLLHHALDLLEDITLALKDYHREQRLEQADERLVVLRVELRLAAACGLLEERQALHALDYCDRIGRQIGGWQRSLDEE